MENNAYPTLPLKNTVLFPHLVLPLSVGRAGSIAAVEAALSSEDKLIAVFPQKDPRTDEPAADDLFRFGTVGIIKKMVRSEDTVQILVQGIERVEQLEMVQKQPYLSLKIATLSEPSDTGTEIEALHRTVIELAGKMIELVQPQIQVGIHHIISDVEKPLHQIYLLTSILSLDFDKEKELLAAATQVEALQLMHRYLNHEVQVLEVRQKITSTAQTEIDKKQREYVLRQQLEAIQEELGETNPEQAEIKELRQRMEETELPELVRKEVEKEITRLERMPSAAPDYQLTRGYVELALELPWNKTTEDRLDLKRAREILDEDHFDLEDVKERIIEHLAVMKLNPEAKSPILCFVGPPGVGKTSVGQSMARALGRKFERMSLGGLHDESELRGHRRTYIGAMPGRIIRAIRRTGYQNPLLMLDEIDKLGRDFRGDPAAALLEILDPAQNAEFHDNYLDLPFDLSKIFFVTTANTLDTIPRPLLDRMEILRLPGYSDEEKQHIARRYLIGRQIREAGLSEIQLSIPDETLSYLIRRYTREAGVRELERMLGRIARKVATQVATGQTQPVTVTPQDLVELLGPERFFAEEMRQQLAPGVAAGLAWTEAGGDVLYVEAALLPEGKGMTLTGQLGSIMQESAKAAQSYLWSRAEELNIDQKTIRESGVHIHVPAGAIPKDGPSAGVTMASALTSAYAHQPVRSDTAMTGEITLSGLVLPVGGIKEKVLAAHRSGIQRIILPKENEKDLREIPEHVRQSIQFILARRIEEVLAEAIPDLNR
ncbi:Peptidase S16, ATP-dependent protease La [Nitrosococcus oceani ATCC 19707]|uniref:Lon protease n=2 Tax=Nitrosococcus oceani TaxID=1229 RepID=LON_NITOC|nr:endopeptidase La [Nitrosococcus oceani]Q3JBB6.1 RecName: Full=Lon protease; AltName: Full=ATP-dependent protease La [Nitrosococcus oceani ATCC 19707]KFI19607.1 peptidase [Nitrosococcus oceani C-27]ABA57880.1 Peptidase S16, ATP-dependent protease La [Nitrosococcus oceani ATCC 19707]EDZ68160.1 ATP-dependent protease La [Nitrosococcus oceani AFC27]GEM19521.1 Lon protease [Nitrosococcus oceani]